jgi:tetratricopeptide (TPR) repeat protein
VVASAATAQVTSDRRWALGLAGGAAAAVIALLVVLGSGGGDADGDAPPTTPTTRDLSSVPEDELEQVVAEHPGVVSMRLALVERYLRDGELELAQQHAEEAAVRATEIPDRATALRYLGWTTALLGEVETGEGLLVQSLALEPADPDGLYFLGRVRFELLDRPDLALVPLEQLEGIEMSDQQRQLVDDLLAEVRITLAAHDAGG